MRHVAEVVVEAAHQCQRTVGRPTVPHHPVNIMVLLQDTGRHHHAQDIEEDIVADLAAMRHTKRLGDFRRDRDTLMRSRAIRSAISSRHHTPETELVHPTAEKWRLESEEGRGQLLL